MSKIIGRSSWGYRAARPMPSAPTNRRGFVLHHSVTPEWTGRAGMRRLNELMIRMGFATVGYTFAIDVQGNIFSGRPLNVVGGHTRGHNTTRHAVVLIGNFVNKRPPPAMEASVVWLYRHGISRGWWGQSFVGHRDVGQTACPGGAAYARLPHYRTASPTSAPSAPERTWFDMATENDLRNVVRGVVREERSAIAAEAVKQLLEWRRSPEHRSLGSWFYSGGVRLDEIESPHPNDVPVVLSRIEDMLREVPEGMEDGFAREDTVVVVTNDVDEGVGLTIAAFLGCDIYRYADRPIGDDNLKTGILVGAAGNLSADLVGVPNVIRVQGKNRQETAIEATRFITENLYPTSQR